MDWNKAAQDFKFNIGDIVRYRASRIGNGVVLARFLEDDGGTEPHRRYALSVHALTGPETHTLKYELELEAIEQVAPKGDVA